MSSNGQPPPVNPAELRIGVDAVQGGVKLTFAYPHQMTQVIIEEAKLVAVLAAIEKARDKIPRVIVP